MAINDIVLPVPPVGEDEQSWDEKAETARKAWELGRRTMVPKPQRPVPGSRLGLCGHEGSNPQSRADGAAMTTIFSPVCGWCLPKHPILEKKP